jgi:uncharacterized protein (TIGR02246 family)
MMMRHLRLSLFAAAAAAASCAPMQKVVSATDAEAAVRQANAEYDRALIAADAVALEDIYTDDFVFVGDKAELRNKREQITYMTNGSLRLLGATSDQIAVTPLGTNHALLTGRFAGRYRAGGTEADFTERYTSVWVRQGSRWRLRHEHSSLAPH